MPDLKLYGYFRSSAAYRVRIALNLKGLAYRSCPVHLLRDGGENRKPQYLKVNPQGLVPALVVEQQVFIQSLPIIEYLDETHPEPPLLPDSADARAWVRSLAYIIACDIHPLNNLRVLQYLENNLKCSDVQREDWYRHWIYQGFDAIEKLLADSPVQGRFCYGNKPSLADICLVPQVYNAKRFNCELQKYINIDRIDDNCLAINEFVTAAPENQPDAE